MQNVMFHVMLSKEEFNQVPQHMPPGASFMFEHFRLIMLAFLVLRIIMLVSSIGLLKRKSWARLVFIVVLSLGILWSLGGVLLQAVLFSSMPEFQHDPKFQEFQTMQSIMQWFMAIFGIGMAVLLGWIVKRLVSGAVKKEFMA
jgi:membrane associated rhomboid family serine protease